MSLDHKINMIFAQVFALFIHVIFVAGPQMEAEFPTSTWQTTWTLSRGQFSRRIRLLFWTAPASGKILWIGMRKGTRWFPFIVIVLILYIFIISMQVFSLFFTSLFWPVIFNSFLTLFLTRFFSCRWFLKRFWRGLTRPESRNGVREKQRSVIWYKDHLSLIFPPSCCSHFIQERIEKKKMSDEGRGIENKRC